MQKSKQGVKMCATIKPHNIRDMTKEMEQAEMRLRLLCLGTLLCLYLQHQVWLVKVQVVQVHRRTGGGQRKSSSQ